jgi:formate hydrogenlyase subunit 4
VHDLAGRSQSLIWTLPGVFLGFLFVLIIKFRKSPFDLSMSHHAHQELVRGITTEFSGSALAMIEVSHWFENILLLGWVYLFFTSSPVLGIAAVLAVYLFVILVDNTFARLKWQTMVKGTWAVTLVLGFGNIMILSFR